MKTIRIGAGSGFWGDAMDPAVELVERGRVDYLALDFLAELTMALLQRQQRRNPDAGYVPDLSSYLEAILPAADANSTRLVCNAGGVNLPAAADQALETIAGLGLADLRVATVAGDNVLERLEDIRQHGVALSNAETQRPIEEVWDRIVAANVYTGAEGILEALEADADIVLTGRVSDSTLYAAPMMHEFGWSFESTSPDLLGAAVTVGHVVECAAGASGGMSSRFAEMPHMGRVGFPIVEMNADGTAVISKCPGTGGVIDEWTIKEHLTYETVDPTAYLAPDAIADFTTLSITETAEDTVELRGMSGRPRPDHLKLVIGYEDGWIGEGTLFFPWPSALARAEKAKATLLERFERLGLAAESIHFDLVGINMLHGPAAPAPQPELNEVGLRVAVKTATRAEAEKVRRACAQLWIMGPGGTSFGVPTKARPVISLWPTLVPRVLIDHTVTVVKSG